MTTQMQIGETPNECRECKRFARAYLGASNELSPVSDVLFERAKCLRPTWVITGQDQAGVASKYKDGGVARRVFERAEVIQLGTLAHAEAAK